MTHPTNPRLIYTETEAGKALANVMPVAVFSPVAQFAADLVKIRAAIGTESPSEAVSWGMAAALQHYAAAHKNGLVQFIAEDVTLPAADGGE